MDDWPTWLTVIADIVAVCFFIFLAVVGLMLAGVIITWIYFILKLIFWDCCFGLILKPSFNCCCRPIFRSIWRLAQNRSDTSVRPNVQQASSRISRVAQNRNEDSNVRPNVQRASTSTLREVTIDVAREIPTCLQEQHRNALRNLEKRCPTQEYSEVYHGKDTNCVICLNDFKQGEMIRVLGCFHGYHIQCIDDWLFSESGRGLCPLCKTKVNLEDSPCGSIESTQLLRFDNEVLAGAEGSVNYALIVPHGNQLDTWVEFD